MWITAAIRFRTRTLFWAGECRCATRFATSEQHQSAQTGGGVGCGWVGWVRSGGTWIHGKRIQRSVVRQAISGG